MQSQTGIVYWYWDMFRLNQSSKKRRLAKIAMVFLHKTVLFIFLHTLVTQPMLQRQPNCTELRLMDSCIQILCRFQKCKRKVHPSLLRSDGGGTFPLQFWNLHKIWVKQSDVVNSVQFG